MAEFGDEWGELYGGAIAQITTHEADAVARLKFHLREKPTAEGVTEIFAERWQILENFLSDLLTLFDLDNAFGDLLDKNGSLLGFDRQGFGDEDYRVFLKARAEILIPNRRTVEGLLSLARALLGPKTLSALGSPIFDPDMSTLIDRASEIQGVPTGTTYIAANDSRDFDGIADFLNWSTIQTLTVLPFSVGFRVRDDDLSLTAAYFRIGPGVAFSVQALATGALRARVDYSVTDVVVDTVAGAVIQGVEHHITVTYDGSGLAAGLQIYVDGLLQAPVAPQNSAGVAAPMTGAWTLGSTSAALFLDGSLRDVRTYDIELTSAEALVLSKGGSRFIDYVENFPKAFILTLEDITAEEEVVFRQFLRLARPATYNGLIHVIPAVAFGFDDSTATITTTRLGFDNASAPPSFGGPYSHVIQL